MSEPIQYSIQPSVLKPGGVEEPYIRTQVALRPEQMSVSITDVDYQNVVDALREGRLIGIQSESGDIIGQLQTSISGGSLESQFISPNLNDIRVGFKASQDLLLGIRNDISFEQIPTTTIQPIISSATFFTAENERVGEIQLGMSGILKIRGSYFLKEGMVAKLRQVRDDNTELNVTLTQSSGGTKFQEYLISEQLLSNFQNDQIGPAPIETYIEVRYNDNRSRAGQLNVDILAAQPHFHLGTGFIKGVVSIERFGGVFYSGGNTTGYLYTSSDGQNWTQVITSPSLPPITSLLRVGGNLYAGTSWGRIYQSADAITWTLVHDSGTSHIFTMKVFSGVIVATSTDKGKVITSIDNGTTWVEVFSPASQDSVWDVIEFDGSYYFALESFSGLLRTTDFITFVHISANIGKVTSLIEYNSLLYAGTYNSEGEASWYESDNAIDWTKKLSISNNRPWYMLGYAGFCYLNTAKGLYRTKSFSEIERVVSLDNKLTAHKLYEYDDVLYVTTVGTKTSGVYFGGQT